MSFGQLQRAVKDRRFSLGVDPLAAARWSDRFNRGVEKMAVLALSLLLVAAAAAAAITAIVIDNYWLVAAIPIQAVAFYFSHPSSPYRKWATVAGAVSIIVFIDLLFNQMPTAATLTAYAGLTFAAVRAAGYIANSAFRRAVISDEELFLAAYAASACTLRENKTKRVYSA